MEGIGIKLELDYEGHQGHGSTVVPLEMLSKGGEVTLRKVIHVMAEEIVNNFMEKSGLKQELPENHYRCELCGGVFEKDRSDAEAIADAILTAVEDGLDPEVMKDPVPLCETCYEKVRKEAKK